MSSSNESRTRNVNRTEDYDFADPTGNFANTLSQLASEWQNSRGQMTSSGDRSLSAAEGYDPNAYMNQFMNQSNSLNELVNGATSPMLAQLNALAADQARLGGESALAAMPGAANSGAGMAAFAEAQARPFAEVNAEMARRRMDMVGDLWNQSMGLNARGQYDDAALASDAANNNANRFANLASLGLQGSQNMSSDTGAMTTPQYVTDPGFMDYLMQGGGILAQLLGNMR
ncbi:MAG: hypothetical protein HC888_02690 [Candidatus Competibacteraceae bacterium]|nr:hypothetical protein [Candidatus Competibacteraceae bacterium]